MIHGATLLLLKYKLPYILHDPRSYLTPINVQTQTKQTDVYCIWYMLYLQISDFLQTLLCPLPIKQTDTIKLQYYFEIEI